MNSTRRIIIIPNLNGDGQSVWFAMSEKEASFIRTLCNRVGGCSSGPRKYANSLNDAMDDAHIEPLKLDGMYFG